MVQCSCVARKGETGKPWKILFHQIEICYVTTHNIFLQKVWNRCFPNASQTHFWYRGLISKHLRYSRCNCLSNAWEWFINRQRWIHRSYSLYAGGIINSNLEYRQLYRKTSTDLIERLRQVHTVRFISCDSFVLSDWNQRDNFLISEFERGCAQLIASCAFK